MGEKKPFWARFRESLQSFYYAGTLITLVLIAVQAFYAKRTVTQSSQWEKAKVTIENIDRFKSYMVSTSMGDAAKWQKADGIWPDFETERGRRVYEETLAPVYVSLFGFADTVAMNDVGMLSEHLRLVDAMDAFAYPIIMGYANEWETFQIALREMMLSGNLAIPQVIYSTPNVGLYARRLYKLWRIKIEIQSIDAYISSGHPESFSVDRAFCYEGTEVTEASLNKYRRKIEKMLKETQKEIKEFRKNNLKQN